MYKFVTTALATVLLAGSAQAAIILPGTAIVSFLAPLDVNIATSTINAVNLSSSVFGTTGGFLTPLTAATFNGTFTFSKIVGGTTSPTLTNLLTFANTITFTATSVQTLTYVDVPGSISGSLYLLGYSSESGKDNTPTSLTLSFNKTGGSFFGGSASLATPPASLVPEPASWALMLVGFGAIGGALRSNRKSAVSFG